MEAELPDHPLLLRREVLGLTRMGRTALHNAVQRRTFPAPLQFSERHAMWRRADIAAWLQGQWVAPAPEWMDG